MKSLFRGALRVLTIVTLTMNLVSTLSLIPSYLKKVHTGDGAGFALSVFSLIVVELPITAIFAITSDSLKMPRSLSPKRLVGLATLSGWAVIISVGVFMAMNLIDSARFSGTSGISPFLVLVPSLIILLPALLLGLVLLLFAQRHRGSGESR
jgi:hypothetical protein